MTMVVNITYTSNTVEAPNVVATILDNVTLNGTGTSGAIYIGNSQHLLLTASLGAKTQTAGTTSVKFHITPCTSAGVTIGTAESATAELVTASVVTGLAVTEATATPLGTYVSVYWDTTGTLAAGTNSFATTTLKLVAK